MRFISFVAANGQPALGLRDGDELVDLTALGVASSLDEVLYAGAEGFARVQDAARRSRARVSREGLRYLPPVTAPSKAFAVGLNYVDHAAESNYQPPKYPVVFQRYPSSWVGHNEPLIRPHVSTDFDYEAEVVAVIGKAGRYITKDRALDHVAGYSLFNDGTIRDYQLRTNQWLLGKNFDNSGSFGPEFVTADELPAGAAGLRLSFRLNGTTLQDDSTSNMIFDVATLVAACSEVMTLQPGDIIISGTPSGVGMARQPAVWMKPGDVAEVELEGIGVLSNPIADEAGA